MGRRPGLPTIYLPTRATTLYWCRFTVASERYALPTGTRDPEQARAEAARLHAEASLGRRASPRRRVRSTLAATAPLKLLVAEFIAWTRATGKAASYTVKHEMHFRAHMLPRWTRLDQITTGAIERYKVARSGEGASLPTLYKELVTLSRFLRWCHRQGHVEAIPAFDRVKPTSEYRPPDLTPEHVGALLAELPDRRTHHNRYPVREFYTFQWAQAMRPGEVQSLTWQDVDLVGKRITIRPANDKARQGRTIGMAVEAVAVIEALALEPHIATARVFGASSYRKSLELAAARAGLPHVTPHHLRHARLSELAGSTRDVGAVQYFAGHRNLSTTDRYVRSRAERTEEMLKGLDSGQLRGSLPKSGRKRGARK